MKTIAQTRRFDVIERRVKDPDDGYHTVCYVEPKNSVAVLPTIDGTTVRTCKCFLIRHFRPVVGESVWECPAGVIEDGEHSTVTASRELAEETGLVSEGLICCGVIYPSPGYTTESIFLYESFVDLDRTLPEREFEPIPLNTVQASDMIERGEIKDAKTIILVSMWISRVSSMYCEE